jgi:hypothetical protein
LPRQKWVVANWDIPSFAGDQAALRSVARYFTDMAGVDKDNASDHVLTERIHDVIRDHPDIQVFFIVTGDGDYGEVIRTLRDQGKQVILAGTKVAMNQLYKHHLTGQNQISLVWLEDWIFRNEE